MLYSQFQPFAAALESVDPATMAEVKQAYENAIATVAPYFTAGQVAAQPYSSLDAAQRGKIVKAAYQFRDRLVDAQNKLSIT